MSLDDARDPSAIPARSSGPVTALARAGSLATALRSLLDEERRAAVIAEPAALEALAARKRHLLESLERLQPELGHLLVDDGRIDAERDALRACLLECRERNAENGVAVRTAAGQVGSALELLRGTLALDDLTLYDERGELHVRRERRRFGEA